MKDILIEIEDTLNNHGYEPTYEQVEAIGIKFCDSFKGKKPSSYFEIMQKLELFMRKTLKQLKAQEAK